MGFAVMTMTDAAAARVKEIVENSGSDAKGIRVGIKKGGCAGMEYTIDLVTEPNPRDDLIARDGASVWLEPAAVLYLLGTEIDFETTTLRSGFTFRNPNHAHRDRPYRPAGSRYSREWYHHAPAVPTAPGLSHATRRFPAPDRKCCAGRYGAEA